MTTIWEVELYIYGMIRVKETLRFRKEKGPQEINPFFSEIEIKNFNEGLIINSTAYAPTRELANNASLIFIGQMLDCLVIDIEEPLYLSYDGKRQISRKSNVKRFIGKHDFEKAFDESRLLSQHVPTFLRAYGWFRKGLVSEDPFDSFLALWNSLEIVASKYHPRNERARNGTISQIWESFKIIWGECGEWPLFIRGNDNWIDENNEIRKDIAHGIANVSIDEVEKVTSKIDTLRMVSIKFLKDWRKTFNNID